MPDDIAPSGTVAAPAGAASSATPGTDSAGQTSSAPAATPGTGTGTPPVTSAEEIPPATPPAQTDSGAKPGESPEILRKRLSDTQAALTRANQEKASLNKVLQNIFGAPPIPGTGASAAPPPPPATPATQPASHTPATPQRYELDPGVLKQLFTKYQAAENDEAAFGVLLTEATNLLMQGLPEVLGGQMVERILQDKDAKVFRRAHAWSQQHAAAVKQTEHAAEAIEKFWSDSVPGIPAELLWSFAPEAQRLKPGDISEQAMYCLEKALEKIAPLLQGAAQTAQISDEIRRGQGAVLPGGSGLPAGGGGGERVPTFVEQMQRANQGL